MSIKGFPTQKKLTTKLTGYTERQSETHSQFITAQPTFSDRVGLDSVQMCLFRIHPTVKSATASTANPKREITSTAHGAKVGDVVRFEDTATNAGFEATVLTVPDANTIILGAETPQNIQTGDDFYILRYTTPRVDETGATIVTIAAAPISFVLDGTDTEVSQDTNTTTNSVPLPVQYLDDQGARVNLATEAKQNDTNQALGDILAATLDVEIAVNSVETAVNNVEAELVTLNTVDFATETTLAALDAKVIVADTDDVTVTDMPSNTGGSVVNGTLTTTSANSEAPPANAVGFILQSESSNANNIRFRIGGTASTTAGVLLEPGRDSGYIPTAIAVSVCNTVSSTQAYSILWVVK